MKKTLLLLVIFCAPKLLAQTAYQKDFNFYWQTIKDNFSYFDRQKTNWDEVKTVYSWKVDTINSR